jgi:creatinine amidohydrolase
MSTDPTRTPRPELLREANHGQLREYRPNLAVLPWGATEAHNYHLPYATDVLQAEAFAERAAALAREQGARPVVLPAVPFGSDAQQVDQVATIHLSSDTAFSLLRDVARSLARQGIRRLVILNSHGGNEFKPWVRDLQLELGVLIVVVDFFRMLPERRQDLFDVAGDHADESETSLLLHLCPERVQLEQAGPGERRPFGVASLRQAGVWTPRPWSAVHPDTGSGDPRAATAEKGERYFEEVSRAIAELLTELSHAPDGAAPMG